MKMPARFIANWLMVSIICHFASALQAQITLTTNPHPTTGDYTVNICPGAPLFFAAWGFNVDPPYNAFFPGPPLTITALDDNGDIITFFVPGGYNDFFLGGFGPATETTVYSLLSITGPDGEPIPINGPTCYTVIICDEPPEISNFNVDITGKPTVCTGGSTQLTAGPVVNGVYTWSTGESTQSITVNTPGTYSVTVTQPCFGTSTASIEVESGDITENVSIDGDGGIICQGNQVVLTAEPGGLNYTWSNGTFDQSITVTTPNTYSVTVTNEFDCSATAAATVGAAPLPTVSFAVAQPQVCSGGCTTVDVAFTGTPPFILDLVGPNGQTGSFVFFETTGSFQWCVPSQPLSGNYIVRTQQLSDALCACELPLCPGNPSFTLNILPGVQTKIIGDSVLCDGGIGNLQVEDSLLTYGWSNGATTQSIMVSDTGIYQVTVTNAVGCTGKYGINLQPSDTFDVALTIEPYACDGALELTTVDQYLRYFWSTGDTLGLINIDQSDTISVIVQAGNGCLGSGSILAILPVQAFAAATGDTVLCPGESGVLSAVPLAAAYSWSTGDTTRTITVASGGVYQLAIVDTLGCRDTALVSVLGAPAPVPTILGPASVCIGSDALLVVSGLFDTYLWSVGDSTNAIQVSDAGVYAVTVTDSNGCLGVDSFNFSVQPFLTPTVNALPYACDGLIVLDAGAGFSTYAWSGGQSTQTISVSNAGDYTVTVTDGTGCSGSDVISISIPTLPTVTVGGGPAICQNTTAELSATPGFDSYAWSNNSVGPNITVGTPGIYTVTATDNLGCTATAGFTLVVNPLPIATVNGPGVICVNSNATLSAAAGLAAYAWSTAETTASISVNTAGTYSVTVTDNNGCTNSGSASITVSAQLDPQVAAQPYQCDGQIGLSANAGFSIYTWSSGQNTPDISATTSGTYGLTVSDANGCTGTTTIQVDVPALPVAAILGPTTFCDGGSTTLNAPAGFDAYAWSTGDNTASTTVSAGGTVGLTVTDALGCTDVASVNASALPLPAPQIDGPSGICAGNNATLSIAGGFTSITWSNGSNASAITVTAAGNYGATVTDANGCVGSTSVDLTVNANPTVLITQAPYQCNQQISLEASPGFAGYMWTGGQTTPSVNVIQTGVYSVTATDANGCTGTATESVSVPQLTQVVITGSPQFCEGGSSTLSAIPGFVSYSWSTGQTGPDIAFTQPDTYSVTATDALGCTSVAGANVSTFLPPQPVISGPSSVCPGSSANLSVPGNFVAYLWSNGAVTPAINVQPPVSVVLTVTDANGCTGTATASVGISNQITPTIVVVQQPCETTAVLDAGAGYQSYLWSTGANTAQISTTQAGAYSVTVADGAGCSGTAQVNVDIPVLPIVNITGEDRFCPEEAAQLQASAGFVNYAWSSGAVTTGILATQAGVYSLTATDGAGCTATATFAVEALTAPSTQITGPALICGGTTASLTAGGGFASYQWSDGQSGVQINVSQPGTYGVTVTDNNGCTGAAQTQLTPGAADTTFVQALSCNPLNVGTAVQTYTGTGGCDSVVVTQTTLGGAFSGTIDINSDFNGFGVSCAGAIDGFVTGLPLGGQAPFQYQWSNGAATATAANIGAGQYTVTITDAAGCSGTATATLSQPTPVLPVIEALGPSCSAPGAITVQSVGGGFGPYTVRLFQDVGVTNGSEVLSFDDLKEGTFTVEVTDANGCTAEELIVLTPIEVINEIVGDTIEIFPGDTVTLNAPITITPVDIVWTSPNATLSCDNCLTPSLAPVRTTELQLFVQGYGDCSAEGRFVILVKTGKQVYIPNVIAPESGTDNNRFTLYGDESVVNIRSLHIYDRWGGKMAVFLNIQPNRPELGWDGRFQGNLMMPGVYVYWAEIEYADGTTEVFQGDLTLVR